VGAAVVGRQAPLAAGLAVAFGSGLILIPLIAVVQAVLGYPLAGSLALGAAAGSAGLLLIGGLAMALGDGLTSGGLGAQVPQLAGAGLAQVPAAWVMAGVAVALFGLVPRAVVGGARTALGVAALITLIGPAIKLAQGVLDVSPFSHIPKLPGAPVTVAPLAWLAGVAVVLAVAGLAGFRRRDLM